LYTFGRRQLSWSFCGGGGTCVTTRRSISCESSASHLNHRSTQNRLGSRAHVWRTDNIMSYRLQPPKTVSVGSVASPNRACDLFDLDASETRTVCPTYLALTMPSRMHSAEWTRLATTNFSRMSSGMECTSWRYSRPSICLRPIAITGKTEKEAVAEDALMHRWSGEVPYAFLPVQIVAKALKSWKGTRWNPH
jgi:hypothetical protein